MKLFTMFEKQNAEFFEKVPPQYETVSHADMRNRRFTKVEENVYRAHTRENVATITCVGDMLCEEKMYHAHRENGNFFFHNVFQYVRPFFCRSDLVIGNLETCLCEDAPYTGEQYKVEGRYHNNAPIELLDAIQQAGFDFLVMANNHNLDCGFNGILETLERVDNAGLMHTGLFRPEEEKRYTIAEVNGIRIAVLAYSTWYNRLADRLTKEGRQQLLNEYSKRRTEADIAAAKSYALGRQQMLAQTAEQISNYYLKDYITTGRYEPMSDAAKMVEAIDKSSIVQLARLFMQSGISGLATVGTINKAELDELWTRILETV